MYQIDNTILQQETGKLKVLKLAKTDALEILSIRLEKDAVFPKHTSPRDAHLIVLEGKIEFYIDQQTFVLEAHQYFDFPKETAHWVHARKNSKFLIIR